MSCVILLFQSSSQLHRLEHLAVTLVIMAANPFKRVMPPLGTEGKVSGADRKKLRRQDTATHQNAAPITAAPIHCMPMAIACIADGAGHWKRHSL
jgi:hypothetical protein